jgi:hypothetical protein
VVRKCTATTPQTRLIAAADGRPPTRHLPIESIRAQRPRTQGHLSKVFPLYNLFKKLKRTHTVHITQNIIEPDGSNRGHSANLLTTAYAARRIIFPTLLWQLTDKLLDILSHVEWIRETAVATAERVLLFNRYYAKNFEQAREAASDDEERRRIDEEGRTTLLSEEEAGRIGRIADESQLASQRSIYLRLMMDFIKLVRGFRFLPSVKARAVTSFAHSTSTISGPATICTFSTS